MLVSSLITLAFAALTSAAPIKKRAPGSVFTECSQPGVLALTFDDGPYTYSWDLAKSLNQQGIPATFFINGKNYVDVETDSVSTTDGEKTYMEVIKHYKDMGHEIGSHTYEHKDLIGLSKADIEYQMNTLSNIIERAAGVKVHMMRPPAGDYDDNAISVLTELGYYIINWDIDTNDWKTHDFSSEKEAYQSKLISGSSDSIGHIPLEHEVYDQTVNELVPWIIEEVKSKNYKFVTMSECLGISPYA